MNLTDLIRRLKKPQQPSEKRLRIKLRTNENNRVEVLDADTGEKITGFSKIYVSISSFGRVSVDLKFKDVGLELETEDVEIDIQKR